MPNRPYSKPFPSRDDIITDKDKHQMEESVVSGTLTAYQATRYSKAEGIIMPKVFVVVFSNGEVREKNYFKWMMHHCAKLKLEFFSKAVSPDDLLKEVINKKSEYVETASLEVPDSYYTVTDIDHFYNDIVRSKNLYEQEDIHLIISNPCFEVWLYYSKRVDKFEGFILPDDKLKFSQLVKRFVNEKIPGGCNPKRAIFDIHQNIDNARVNYEEDSVGIPGMFATNMFLLAETLLPYIEDDIRKVIEKSVQSNKDSRR